MKIEPTTIKFVRVRGEDRFEIHLESSVLAKHKSIFFEVTFSDAMRLLNALRELQAKYKIPIPPNLRSSGKPTLSLVTDDDD
jgi:hypothetical protein